MRHDWARIRGEYITGQESLRALAERCGISLSQIALRSAKEDWQEQREQERERVRRLAVNKSRDKRVKREAAALERVEGQIEHMIGEIEEALSDRSQLYRHVIYVGKGQQDEATLAKMDTRAARDYVSMLADLKGMLDEFGDTMGKREREELRLKKARLKLDTQKAGLMGSTDENETGVILMPPLDTGENQTVEVGAQDE